MFCGTGPCAWGFWISVGILIGAAASAVGLLGFLLYRRLRRPGKPSTAQQ